jgi:thiamine transport system substrate-binding protein
MANDALVVADWETAYYTEFTRAGGTRPIVVSYGSSPPFEAIGLEPLPDLSPTGAVTSPETCFRQVEFAGIVTGTPNREAAERWIDFMLGEQFQRELPQQMFVLPVVSGTPLDADFERYLDVAERPAAVSAEAIAQSREQWIRDWSEVVLR